MDKERLIMVLGLAALFQHARISGRVTDDRGDNGVRDAILSPGTAFDAAENFMLEAERRYDMEQLLK